MPIRYPEFFEARMRSDPSLRSGVDGIAAAFEGWLNSSRLPFFVDYTDHGIDHLTNVLFAAEALIPPGARQAFSPADTAVLIVATLFHDCALHLSESGFRQLIKGEAAEWRLDGFGDLPWPIAWENFLFTARRWDEKQLRSYLGETPAGEIRSLRIRDPFEYFDDLSDTDRKLIGEFIRRHHHRMAHEFATFGVPGRTVTNVAGLFPPDLLDLSGVVARSHGLPVRSCLGYLAHNYNRREYMGVHAVYVMTLLRVADYLQVQADRAPDIVFQYRHIPSPASELEWKAHNAVRSISRTHEDPESIEIHARPPDVATYLRVKEWLLGIQSELDASWAVIGETYGMHQELSQLGLALRRVRSNLDDGAAFGRQMSYVPERVELAVARPDLLRLLVGPLYDNEPSVGVRELLQNAIDAVRERIMLEQRFPELRGVQLVNQDCDVEIWLGPQNAAGDSWLSISDRGIGMSADVVRDYFLTAGASFRSSEAWRRDFEDEGSLRGRVLRSGRFGVGVLAAFLLGSEIEVSTRHIRSETGIKFSTTLDFEPIELRLDSTLPIGTVVRIMVSAGIRAKLLEANRRVAIPLAFDWFAYSEPSVSRIVGEDRVQLPTLYSLTPPSRERSSEFRLLPGDYSYDIYWTYRPLPLLTVNGIHITDSATRARLAGLTPSRMAEWDGALHVAIKHPNICIDDPDAQFHLNLRRSDITERHYPFGAALVDDITNDFIAHAVVHRPCADDSDVWSIPPHPGVELRLNLSESFSTTIAPWGATATGIIPLCSPFLSEIEFSAVAVAFSDPDGFLLPTRQEKPLTAISSGSVSRATSYTGNTGWPLFLLREEWPFLAALEYLWLHRSDEEGRSDKYRDRMPIGSRNTIGVRIILPERIGKRVIEPEHWDGDLEADFNEFFNSRRLRNREKLEADVRGAAVRMKRYSNGLILEEAPGTHLVFATAECPPTELDIGHLGDSVRETCVVEVCVSSPSVARHPREISRIAAQWRAALGSYILPYRSSGSAEEVVQFGDVPNRLIATHQAMREAGLNC